MNARQKVKKLKKEISTLKSDNDLMREIIADSPAMQELYDLYNKPKFVTHTTMQFQEYQSRVFLDSYIIDDTRLIETLKQEIAEDLFNEIKENITYEVDTECRTPIITASIFIGREE
jgi:hypothetical protein